MSIVDWVIVAFYLIGIVAIGFYLMVRQRNAEDYYMGGRRVPAWLIATSVVATQSSAVSLLGGPAFVAVRDGGGLLWLQYEFAVPLAMAGLIPLMVYLRRLQVISIYEAIETGYGPGPRFVVSLLFQLSRILATGVSLYATAILFSLLLKVPLIDSILLLGGVALLYTMLGGIMADIISDFIQLVVLFTGVLIAVILLWMKWGGELISAVPLSRLQVIDPAGHGFGGGHPYGLWPMLFGGFFLYLSYYGCDQSQAQRLLTGDNEQVTVKALVLNGILRFPLVLTYVVFGVFLAGFVQITEPSWLGEVMEAPDRLVPLFIRDYFPAGARGLFMSAVIAAAMSSFDSAYNSVSAATYRDLVRIGWIPERLQKGTLEVWVSRALTMVWGGFSILFALWISRWQNVTVIELINMVGSVLYGPILFAFFLTLFVRGCRGSGLVVGLASGVFINLVIARYLPQVSWLWWNVIGFFASLGMAFLWSRLTGERWVYCRPDPGIPVRRSVKILIGYFFVVVLISLLLPYLMAL